MELQSNPNNLCILFIDPVSKLKDKIFRESIFNFIGMGILLKGILV